jgi:hypothetical protein
VNNDGDIVVPVDVRGFGHWLNLLLGPASTAARRLRERRHRLFGAAGGNSTITINGTVFTFVASGATGNQINIGAR